MYYKNYSRTNQYDYVAYCYFQQLLKMTVICLCIIESALKNGKKSGKEMIAKETTKKNIIYIYIYNSRWSG